MSAIENAYKNVLFKNLRFHAHLLNCPYFFKNIMIESWALLSLVLFFTDGSYCKIAYCFRLMKRG